jgi:hypothetical protein
LAADGDAYRQQDENPECEDDHTGQELQLPRDVVVQVVSARWVTRVGPARRSLACWSWPAL